MTNVRIKHSGTGAVLAEGPVGRMYWLPNPLLPFIWFRVALPRRHPEIDIEEY